MKAKEYLEIIHLIERLKDTTRHCTTSMGRKESVAEHSFRISLMAMLLRDIFPEADIDRVICMCLIHDLGECFTGDIPVFNKTKEDEKKEEELLHKWVESLPSKIAEEFKALYAEMEKQSTIESKIYKALDKIEAVIQHNESPLDTWEDNEYELNQTYGYDAVEFSAFLKELRDEILKETKEKIEAEIKK